MMQQDFDVVVIGAGASGMMAALELGLAGKKVAVVEGRPRIGGRVHTLTKNGFTIPIEAGAEFVHGELELTHNILKNAGIEFYEIKGDIWKKEDKLWSEQKDFIENFNALNKRLKALDTDLPVKSFIEKYLTEPKFEETKFTLKNYVEGYYAADLNYASTFATREELNKSDESQYRIEGGYGKLFEDLYERCKRTEVQFFLSQEVHEVHWKKSAVEVFTSDSLYKGTKLVVTVPVGVLRKGQPGFSPSLDQYVEAAKRLGYGGVIKTILQFRTAFWKNKAFTQGKDLRNCSFIFSNEKVPTWWTSYPKEFPVLTGWSGGPHADKIKDLEDEQILHEAIESLSTLFDIQADFIENQICGWHVANWVNDRFSCGGYSYEVVDGADIKRQLKTPVENTIYFTGEGLYDGTEIGTVNAAFVMGRETAHQLIADFKN